MNNNIEEDYCSFEVSKLLKDKGFQVKVREFFAEDRSIKSFKNFQLMYFNGFKSSFNKSAVSRPTHALAIKWIRENFGIHIFADFGIGWQGIIVPVGYIGEGIFPNNQIDGYKSPEEATEAALLYTLQNLIK